MFSFGLVLFCFASGGLAQETTILPKTSAGVTTVLSYVASTSENGTFQLVWTVSGTGAASLIAGNQYVAVGFQSGVAANTGTSSRYMAGPSGTDFFALRDGFNNNTVQGVHLSMAARPATNTTKGWRPTPVSTLISGATAADGSRIQSVSSASNATNIAYTLTIDCRSNATGSTDFNNRVAVLYATGTVDTTTRILQPHARANREWVGSSTTLTLFTMCSSPPTSPPTTSTDDSNATVTTDADSNTTTTADNGKGSGAGALFSQLSVAMVTLLFAVALL